MRPLVITRTHPVVSQSVFLASREVMIGSSSWFEPMKRSSSASACFMATILVSYGHKVWQHAHAIMAFNEQAVPLAPFTQYNPDSFKSRLQPRIASITNYKSCIHCFPLLDRVHTSCTVYTVAFKSGSTHLVMWVRIWIRIQIEIWISTVYTTPWSGFNPTWIGVSCKQGFWCRLRIYFKMSYLFLLSEVYNVHVFPGSLWFRRSIVCIT